MRKKNEKDVVPILCPEFVIVFKTKVKVLNTINSNVFQTLCSMYFIKHYKKVVFEYTSQVLTLMCEQT